MVLDQTMLDFHNFHQFDLISVGRLPGILPNQNPFAVGEPIVVSVPPYKLVRPAACPLFEERTNLPMPPEDATAPFKDRRHKRRFKNGILRIEREISPSVSSDLARVSHSL
jgi:hypothetical protein